MKTWLIYEGASGRILTRMRGSEPTEDELQGAMYIEGDAENIKDVYVQNAVLTQRPSLFLTTSSTSFTTEGSFIVTGIPQGTLVVNPEENVVVDDGEFEFSVTLPGTYKIRFEKFPYLPKEYVLDVNNSPA